MRLEFTSFSVWPCDGLDICACDFVKVTDGDGTILMDKSCGISSLDPSSSFYFLPPIITTRSNRVDIVFHTNGSGRDRGWSLSWSVVTPGMKALLLLLFSCISRIFYRIRYILFVHNKRPHSVHKTLSQAVQSWCRLYSCFTGAY